MGCASANLSDRIRMYSAEQSGRGRSPTHGPEPDSQRIEDGDGAARSAQREDTAPSETTRKARRLSFDFPGQGCWADIQNEGCQAEGERAKGPSIPLPVFR